MRRSNYRASSVKELRKDLQSLDKKIPKLTKKRDKAKADAKHATYKLSEAKRDRKAIDKHLAKRK